MRVAALDAGGADVAGGRAPGPRRAPVPVHRLAADRRRRRVVRSGPDRDGRAAGAGEPARRRAALEGGTAQAVGPVVAAGGGGFADDLAPADALVAIRGDDGDWHVGETRHGGPDAGRAHPGPAVDRAVDVAVGRAAGDWVRTLRTTWVEPGYLEPDASWCEPGGEPVTPLANGGAFGGKVDSEVASVARRLADEHGRAVRVLYTREDVVRRGPKRPPIAAGIRADGTGVVRVVRTAGHRRRHHVGRARSRRRGGRRRRTADVERAAWRGLGRGGDPGDRAAARTTPSRRPAAPGPARRSTTAASTSASGAADPLDAVVLRSYGTGAAHMALGWVRSEGLAVDDAGVPVDLTIRSFGILRASEVPPIHIEIEPDDGPPVNGSDAVFGAVAAAAWRAAGHPPLAGGQ